MRLLGVAIVVAVVVEPLLERERVLVVERQWKQARPVVHLGVRSEDFPEGAETLLKRAWVQKWLVPLSQLVERERKE